MRLLLMTVLLAGCARKSPQADPEFSDAARYLFRSFESSEADLAFAMRSLETQVYLGMDVESSRVNDRALLPEFLEASDVDGLTLEPHDLSLALPVAVAGVSPFELVEHPRIQMLVDQTPVEPYSPAYYERTFLLGQDCWQDRSCPRLETFNALTKENALMTIDTEFYKDFRWVDLNLPDPSSLEEGEEPVNTGDPRWAYVARSWQDRAFPGRGENTSINQSYTIEVWIPRDGGGLVRDSSTVNVDGGEWTGDSTGGGTLRMLALWAETDLGFAVGDDLVIGTTRGGIDTNFQAADHWLGAP